VAPFLQAGSSGRFHKYLRVSTGKNSQQDKEFQHKMIAVIDT